MTALSFKMDDKLTDELDMIREREGLGNRTATFAFLIKYYLLTTSHPLRQSIGLLKQLILKFSAKDLKELTKESKAWDAISDEDFMKFEKNL